MGAFRDYRVIDGSSVSVDFSDDADLTQRFATFSIFDWGSHRQEFAAGTADFGAVVAEHLEIVLDESYSYQGGTLRIGSTILYDEATRISAVRRFGVWEGVNHSLKTLLHHAETADMIALLDQFSIEETPAGITLHPNEPKSTRVVVGGTAHVPRLLQNVPGLGLLEIKQRTPAYARRLPVWSGRRTRGGELFVEDRDSDQMTLLLVGEGVLTRLYPNAAQASEETMIDRFSEGLFRWGAAGE